MRFTLLLGFTLLLCLGKEVGAQNYSSVLLVMNESNEPIPFAKVKNKTRNYFCFADQEGKLRYDTLFADPGDTFEISSLDYQLKTCFASEDSSGINLIPITAAAPQFAASQSFSKTSISRNNCVESLPLIFMPGQVVCFRLPVDQFSLYLTDLKLKLGLEVDSVKVRVALQDPAAKPGTAYVGQSKIMYLKKTGKVESSLNQVNMLSATATKQHWIIIEFLPDPSSTYKLVWTGCHTSAQPKSHPKIKGRLGIGTIQDEWYNRMSWYPSFEVSYKHN